MWVLVTGGAGYIGSHTCVELLAAGHDVLVVDNLCNSSEEAVRRVERISGRAVPFRKLDLLDADGVDRVFREHPGIDAVIHFAGLKSVGESVADPLGYYRNNLVGTMNLLSAMKAYGVRVLIFSSSATVYGNPEGQVPVSEDTPVGGTTNPYGTSKLFQERVLSDLYRADPGWCIVILRYFNPVGAHPSGLIGEDPRGVPANLVPYIAGVASGRFGKLHVYGDDYDTVDGTGVRDYIHVVDLAKGHVAALDKLRGRHGVFTYNLGTGRGYSVLEVLRAYERACGRALPYDVLGRRPGDVAVCYADAEKAWRELGWKARLGLDEMCRSSWKWQTMNPDGYDGREMDGKGGVG